MFWFKELFIVYLVLTWNSIFIFGIPHVINSVN